MKSILLSIHPKYCAFIASGIKTIEVRKNMPKIATPFKCYIYATKPKHFYHISKYLLTSDESLFLLNGKVQMYDGFGVEYKDPNYKHLNCKVIGEFICDEICIYTQAIFDEQEPIDTEEISELLEQTKLTYSELRKYVGNKNFYTWHISDIVIYDNPKDLSEFYTEGDCDCMNCKKCAFFDRGNDYNVEDDCNLAYKGANAHKSFKPITRPPQSWCYVEGIK